MEISKEELQAFLARSWEVLMQEMNQEKESACIVFSGIFDEELNGLLEKMERENSYEWTAVLSKEQSEDPLFIKLASKKCKKILLREEAMSQELYKGITFYPMIKRDFLAKAALGISDTFEVEWMQKAFETNGQLKIMAAGLPPFTGREPEAYKQRILSYVRMLLEYGIEFVLDNEER